MLVNPKPCSMFDVVVVCLKWDFEMNINHSMDKSQSNSVVKATFIYFYLSSYTLYTGLRRRGMNVRRDHKAPISRRTSLLTRAAGFLQFNKTVRDGRHIKQIVTRGDA